MVDINTIAKFSKTWLFNTIENITYINSNNTYLLSDLKNKFKGQAALIAGAGPSLTENIEYIKNHRENFVIFAVNKAVKYLLQNNIIPDFIVCLDANFVKKTLEGTENYLKDINVITDIRTDKNVAKLGFKKYSIIFQKLISL